MDFYFVTDGMRAVVLRAAGCHGEYADLKSLDKAMAHDLIDLDPDELPFLRPLGALYLVETDLLSRLPPRRAAQVSRLAKQA